MSSNGNPVARWLNTFVNNSNISKEYVDIFKQFGFETLKEICTLDVEKLINMGIAQDDSNKIMQNVSVLRQTLQAGALNYNTNIQQNHSNLKQPTTTDTFKISPSIQEIEKPLHSGKIKTTRKSRARSETKTKRILSNISTSQQIKPPKPVKPIRFNNETLMNDSDVANCLILPEVNHNYQNQSLHYFENNFDANYSLHERSFSTQNRSPNYNNLPERHDQSQYPHFEAPDAINSYVFIQRSTHEFDSNYNSPNTIKYSLPLINTKSSTFQDNNLNTFNSNTNMCNQIDKNSSTPLQYLERLVKLPQPQVVNPKSIIGENLNLDSILSEQRSNSEQENPIVDEPNINGQISESTTMNNQFDSFNRINKPSNDGFKNIYSHKSKLNEASFPPSNGNLSNLVNKQNNGKLDSNSNQIANKNMTNSDSPSSSCSSMSNTSSISSSSFLHSSQSRTEQNMMQSSRFGNCQQIESSTHNKNNSNLDYNDNEQLVNLIDTNSFELFDCLPELSSSVIEQLIDESPTKMGNFDYGSSSRENLDNTLVLNNFYPSISNAQTPTTDENEPTYVYIQFNPNSN